MNRPECLWSFVPGASPPGTAAFTDYTDNSGNPITSITPMLTSPNNSIPFIASSSNIFYIGFSRRFVGFVTDLSTNGSYLGLSVKYLAVNNAWKNVQAIDYYDFSASKYMRWNLPPDWARIDFTSAFPGGIAPPDNTERYWIQLSATTVTIQAVISYIRLIPYAQYTDAKKVSEFLELKKPFDLISKPSENTVEDMIRRAEDRIDYRTKKSWRFNAVTEQTDPVSVDFSRSGMFLRHRDFFRVYSVQIWNGGSYSTLTPGRQNDYLVDWNLGMIYLTRTYILPAVYGIGGRFTQYNIGEYKNSVLVDLAFGRDSETDMEFHNIEDICIKIVAIQLLRHHDYSSLVVSGSDHVSISEKISTLEEEVEMQLDEETGISLI